MSSSYRSWFARGLLAVAFCSIASALPVFPGAVGFGTQTIAGRGGQVYRVTNLNNSGLGSLRYGVENVTGPRVIIFDVSGVINLQKDIVVRHDSSSSHAYLTIAGQTAPPPGITLRNGGIVIKTHDVLIQHIAIRVGNFENSDPGWNLTNLDNRDCIRIGGLETEANPYNIVIDHVTSSWAVDEGNSVSSPNQSKAPFTPGAVVSNVTFSNCIIAHPILDGGHEKGLHGYGTMAAYNVRGGFDESVSFIRNLLAFNWARNPLIRARTSGAQVVNNVIYRPGPSTIFGIWVGSSDPAYPNEPMKVSAIGNVLVRHPAPFTIQLRDGPVTYNTVSTHAVRVASGASTAVSMYVNNNSLYDPATSMWITGDPWIPPLYKEDIPTTHLTSNPHANSGGTSWSPWSGDHTVIESQVLATAGKHPGARDAIDAPLIASVQNRTGTFLSQLDPATNPWAPVDIQSTRVLPLPPNPGFVNPDGYTNLEKWLHSWAAIVEGAIDPPNTFLHDFAGGNANGWTPDGGTWSVASQVYKQTDTGAGANRSVLTATNWTDQVIEADVKLTAVSGSNRFFGVVARYRDPNNYYYFVLRTNNTIELKRLTNGSVGNIDSGSYTVASGTTYRLRLEAADDTLRAYINDVLVLQGPDNTHALGRTGLITHYTAVDFDNIFTSSSLTQAIFDTFEDGNADGWTPDGGTWSVVAGGGTQAYRQSNDGIAAVRSTVDATAGWTDQVVEADVKLNSASGSNRFFGLVARQDSANDYYYFILRTNNTIELKKLENGTATTLDSGAFTVTTGTWYALQLEVLGTSLKAYVNGQLKLQATDSQFASGKAGLVTYFTSVDFDDVYVDAVPNSPVLVADDFEDGNANGWTPSPGSTWSVVTDGTLVYRQTNMAVSGAALSVTGDAGWTDQIIEVDAKPIAFDGTNRWFGLLARYIDENNYYYITFRTSNVIELRKLAGGAISTLKSTPLTLTTGTWYVIKLKAIGNSLKVYVNGELKLQETDSAHPAGKIGLVMNRGDVAYDDVIVTKP